MVEVRPKKISERIESYDYLLYRIGDTYFAKNGLSGNIDYSSSNFKSVYDAVSAVLTVSGGSIVLRSGDTFTATAGLSGYSNVNVISDGATLQVYSDTGGVHALTFTDIVNSVWEGVNIERVGVDADSSYVVYVGGTTDDTTKFLDCVFTNLVTGVASRCHGFYSFESSAPIVSDCVISGGSGGTYCRGFYSEGSSSPVVTGCTVTGGSGGAYSHGFFSGDSSSPVVTGCTVTGGSGGIVCYGFVSGGSSAPVVTGCTVTGGSGGTRCYGFYSYDSSSPVVTGCTVTGGSGGTNCHGFVSEGSSSPTVTNNNITPQQFTSSWSYNSADNGRFQPFATHPYILRGIYVLVNVATAGVTLDLGTTATGTEIATGIDISTTGTKYFNFTSPVEVAGDGYFYATPSGATANGAFAVYYIVSTNYASCYGAVIDTKGYLLMSGCPIVANGASDAVRINSNSVSYPYFKVTNCHLESLDATNQYAVSASGALADAPIYNCVLVHSLLNVTPDAGTQQGTNWQDPLVAYEEALPLKNEYVTKLLNLVAKEKLDSDSLYFTSAPLEMLVETTDLVGKDLDTVVVANKNIEDYNNILIKNAKSLSVLVKEKTGKMVEQIIPPKENIISPVYLENVDGKTK